LVYQCQRCKDVFANDDELDSHIEADRGCNTKPTEHVDGITKKMKEQIQCRKKAFPGQTEAERWKQIYQILFPDEAVPSPCKSHIEKFAHIRIVFL
jgi:Zn-finger nucleic acid-binding protein